MSNYLYNATRDRDKENEDEKEKEKERKKQGCPKNSRSILWPPAIWLITFYGDTGATNFLFDRPPTRVLTKVASPPRTVVQQAYRNANPSIALAPRGEIHHKWPLYLGDPDIMENLVFLTIPEHRAWHTFLNLQGVSGWMSNDPNGTTYCITN